MKKQLLVACVLASLFRSASPAAAQQQPLPRIAVYGFNSEGLDRWWGSGGFDPGDALSDIMTDKLVNANAFNVVDRTHIDQVLGEQNLSRSGDVAPDSESKLGRMLGANYLVFGRIIQFDKTGGSNAGAGGLAGRLTGGLLGGGGIAGQTIKLHATIRIVEANTGRIAATADDEATKSGTSFSLAGIGGSGGGSYSSSEFESSSVGQVITTVAEDLVKKIDPAKLALAGAQAHTIAAKILAVDGTSVIINAGTNRNVTVGSYFTIYQTKELKDPDSGKMLESHSKRGSIQIVSVDKETAVGKLVDGQARTGLAAMSDE